jgi:hypothetical protein
MPLRIGFDMDGVLADFATAFHQVETRLFGPGAALDEGRPELEEQRQEAVAREEAPETPRAARRRRDRIWRVIESTPNFWATLQPLDPGAVRRIHELMLEHQWEVFFVTQRPRTEGETVQRQTQRWLVSQGFDLPTVLVLGGSRGAAANALRLNYHVDDSTQNCLDVISESRAKALLVVPHQDEATITSARKLGIGTAPSIGECLTILEQATLVQTQPGLLQRIASIVGWK